MATADIARDTTLQLCAQYLETLAAKAELEMAGSTNDLTIAQIRTIVEKGYASDIWNIGDQLVTTYTYSGTEYEMPFDIVSFDDVTDADGESMPGMWLQSHYATIESIMFDGYEAFYVATDGLSAGTYYITMATAGTAYSASSTWQFTLTRDVPEGGVLAGFRTVVWDSSSPEGKLVYSYESQSADYSDYVEAVEITEGSDGTSLGTFYATSAAADSGLNHLHRVSYGYNRWSQSAYRQFLNSDADAGSWWAAQNDFDLPPSQLSTYAGFLQGFDEDFLTAIGEVQVTTALNTVEGLSDTSEVTVDKFFLPSLEQLYVTPQLAGVEGDYWPYWKQVLGLEETEATGSTNADRITYALHLKSSAQYVRLRSANRGYAASVWIVGSTGYVSYGNACNAVRSAPACVIH